MELMTPEQQLTALRLLKLAADGHPFIKNDDIREINMFINDLEKKLIAQKAG